MVEKNVLRKGFVIGIIVLFIGASFTPMNVVGTQSPEEEWNKKFGGASDDIGEYVQQTNDGGYIIAGRTGISSLDRYDALLIKTDVNGNELWSKTFGDGGSGKDWIECVQQTIDGGYILGGSTKSYGAGDSDWWLIKTDSNGNKLWDKTFGGSSLEVMQRAFQTADSGYILVGNTYSFDVGGGDIWLIKTDSNGNQIWSQTFGGSNLEHGFSVQQITGGGYIITGLTKSYGTGDEDVWLIKTDSSGNMIWNKTFGGSDYDYGYTVRQTPDGGYIIGGGTTSFGAGLRDAWLIKTDVSGNKLWDKTFGGTNNDWGHTVQTTSDGGYILSGVTYSYGAGNADIWLIKTDANGNHQWNKTFGGNNEEFGRVIQQTNDNGYVVIGETKSFGAGGQDVWFIKIEPEESIYRPWPMYQHDSRRTGKSSYIGPQTPDIKWEFTFYNDLRSSVVGNDGVIYALTKSGLYAINPDGSQKWYYSAHDLGWSRVPAIDNDGNIYILWQEGISALTSSGDLKWFYPLYYTPLSGYPVVHPNGAILVPCVNLHSEGVEHIVLYAFAKNGTILWMFDCGYKADPTSPAVDLNGDIYFGVGGRLFALYQNGSLKWNKVLGKYLGDPSIGSDNKIYIVGGGGTYDPKGIYAILPNGSISWKYGYWSFMGGDCPPAIAGDGSIYVAFSHIGYPGLGHGYLLKLDYSGNGWWEKKIASNPYVRYSSPLIDGNGTIYIVVYVKVLRAYYPDGTEKWYKSFPDIHGHSASLSMGPDGTLYLAGDQRLIAIGQEDQPPDPPTNPNPVNEATNVDLNPTLSVEVSDPDGQDMDITFYDAVDGTIIGTDYGVPSGGTATTTWSDLFYFTRYFWYAVASDGIESTQSSIWEFITKENQYPEASFDVIPSAGEPTIEFEFNASSCSDYEDDTSDLQVRWDWENDGIWDTEWTTNKIALHRYYPEGIYIVYTVKLAVKDTGGLESYTTNKVIVYFDDSDDLPESTEWVLAEHYFPILYFDSEPEKCFPTKIKYHLNNSNLNLSTKIPPFVKSYPLEVIDIKDCNNDSYFMDNIQGKPEYNSKIISHYENNRLKYGDVVYVHLNKSEYAGITYTVIQYWFFYAFNNGEFNQHEGDWEMVQVLLDEQNSPAYLVCTQHNGRERRSWNNIDKVGDHPIVYVALGSHANYFTTEDDWIPWDRKLIYKFYNDLFDGNGPKLDIDDMDIVLLGERSQHPDYQNWLDYAGRWGDFGVFYKMGDCGPQGPMYRYDRECWDYPAQWALKWQEIVMLTCPVNLTIIDDENKKIGFVDSEFINEILGATADIFGDIEIYYLPTDLTYTYELRGYDEGTYNFTIINEQANKTVNITGIPVFTNLLHQYTINWTVLSQGKEGVTIKIDADDDGIFERTITSDDELTQDEFILQTETTIDINPDTLNLNSTGNWITCYIELPDGYNVEDINISSILLNYNVFAESHPINISDYDEDGITDLMVKFNRQDVIAILEPGDNVEIKITGELLDGTKFEGIDYIKVI